jgi:small-conductance mechanosensitive channel
VAPAEAPTHDGRGFALPVKLIAFLLTADAVFVWGSHIFPAHADDALWRHMAVGTLGQNLGVLVLSLLMALAAGALSGNRRLNAAVGRISLGAIVLLLLLLVPFLLDSRTLSASLPEVQRPRFAWLVAKGVLQYLLAALAFGATGVAARRFLAADPEAEPVSPPAPPA